MARPEMLSIEAVGENQIPGTIRIEVQKPARDVVGWLEVGEEWQGKEWGSAIEEKQVAVPFFAGIRTRRANAGGSEAAGTSVHRPSWA